MVHANAELLDKANLPVDATPYAHTLPPSSQPEPIKVNQPSARSSTTAVPVYDANGAIATDPSQAGAFNLAQTPSHKLNEKHLEAGLSDEDSSLNQMGERTLSWEKTAVLLLGEYIGFALLAFPYSFQILGMAGGLIATIILGFATLYTTHILWRFCMAYPQCRDIADCAYYLFGEKRWAWRVGFTAMALNNLFVMGLHVNIAQSAINTLGYRTCSAVIGLVAVVIQWGGSLLRNLQHATPLGVFSALSMVVCVLIVIIGHGVQGNPNKYVDAATTPLTWTVWAPEGTTYVQGMSAYLNIAYSYIGQALVPSWIGDMAHPEDFPKALYSSMAVEITLMCLTGAIVYAYSGTYLTTSPAYGSLIAKYGRPAAAFVLPPAIIVGILYSLVTCRAIFFQVYHEKSIHRTSHTKKGWLVWTGIVTGAWTIAYIIGQAIPFFSDLLSLISSLFGSWFGFALWACAYYKLYRHQGFWCSKIRCVESVLNIIVFITGIYMFGAGSYSSVQSIITSYADGNIKAPFTCKNTGFEFTR